MTSSLKPLLKSRAWELVLGQEGSRVVSPGSETVHMEPSPMRKVFESGWDAIRYTPDHLLKLKLSVVDSPVTVVTTWKTPETTWVVSSKFLMSVSCTMSSELPMVPVRMVYVANLFSPSLTGSTWRRISDWTVAVLGRTLIAEEKSLLQVSPISLSMSRELLETLTSWDRYGGTVRIAEVCKCKWSVTGNEMNNN